MFSQFAPNIKNYGLVSRGLYSVIAVLSILLYPLLLTRTGSINSTETFIDQYIPFWPVFVIPYIFYLLLVAGTLIYLLWFSKNYKREVVIFALAQMLASVCYFFFQTKMETAIITNSDIFSQLVQWVYNTDRPYNLFPSLHTANSILCYLFLKSRLPQFWSRVLLVISTLIVISTVLIKQHYFMDIIGGLILSFGVHYLANKYYKLK